MTFHSRIIFRMSSWEIVTFLFYRRLSHLHMSNWKLSYQTKRDTRLYQSTGCICKAGHLGKGKIRIISFFEGRRGHLRNQKEENCKLIYCFLYLNLMFHCCLIGGRINCLTALWVEHLIIKLLDWNIVPRNVKHILESESCITLN